MNSNDRNMDLCMVSGTLWGLFVTGMFLPWIPSGWVPGGLIASPIIGYAIGAGTKRWRLRPLLLRIGIALVSLYVAAAMFGIGIGFSGWLSTGRLEAVVEGVFMCFYGLTNFLFLFWPLAYLTHWLLARVSPALPRVRSDDDS